MRVCLFICLCLLVGSADALAKPKVYAESDAGCLVYAVGTVEFGMRFQFPYQRVARADGTPVNDWLGYIEPTVGGAIYLKIKNPDFVGKETGHVVVRCLPPGSYEIDKFQFFGSIPGIASYKWEPNKAFSMPFKVRSGEATYIGSFMRALPPPGAYKNPDFRGGIFIVADRSIRDLPIAGPKLPAGMKITKEVTDVSKFGLPPLMNELP